MAPVMQGSMPVARKFRKISDEHKTLRNLSILIKQNRHIRHKPCENTLKTGARSHSLTYECHIDDVCIHIVRATPGVKIGRCLALGRKSN